MIVFPGDFVILKGEYRWLKVTDCDGGMMMQLSDDRWVEASDEVVGDLKSKYEFAEMVSEMAIEVDKVVLGAV